MSSLLAMTPCQRVHSVDLSTLSTCQPCRYVNPVDSHNMYRTYVLEEISRIAFLTCKVNKFERDNAFDQFIFYNVEKIPHNIIFCLYAESLSVSY